MNVKVSVRIRESSNQHRLPRMLIWNFPITARLCALRVVEVSSRARAIRPFFFVRCQFRYSDFHAPSNVSPTELISGVNKRAFTGGCVLGPFTSIEDNLPYFKGLTSAVYGGGQVFPYVGQFLVGCVDVITIMFISR